MQPNTPQPRLVGVIPPPPGVTPDFVKPAYNAQGFLAVHAAFAAMSTAFTALRLYTTRFVTRKMGLDDCLIIFSWLLALSSSITACMLLRYGLGYHLWEVPFSRFNNHYLKIGAISGTFYGISIMFVKLSILIFYLRFSQATRIRITVYVTMTIVVAYSVPMSFEWLYACRPIAKYWDSTVTGGSCIDWLKITVASGVLNTVTDAMILVLPIWMLWKLKVPKRQKIGVMLTLMTGGLYVLNQPSASKGSNASISVLAVSIVRVTATADGIRTMDITWAGTNIGAWWAIELHVAIICACLPEGKPFLRRHFPKVLGSRQNSHGGTRSYTRTRSPTRRSVHLKAFSVKHTDEIPLCESPKGVRRELSQTIEPPCSVEQTELHHCSPV